MDRKYENCINIITFTTVEEKELNWQHRKQIIIIKRVLEKTEVNKNSFLSRRRR